MSTQPSDWPAIVERLERRNCRLLHMGAVMLVCTVAVALMGQTRPGGRTIEAEAFVLKDPAGKTRALLGFVAGKVTLVLQDKSAAPRVQLLLEADGSPAFTLATSEGKPRVQIAITPDGKASLLLGDRKGARRLALTVLPDSSGALAIIGTDGKSMMVSAEPDNLMGIALFDQKPQTRAELLLQPDGSPQANLYDRSGKVLWRAP